MRQVLLINTVFHSEHAVSALVQSYRAGVELNDHIEICEVNFRELQISTGHNESKTALMEEDAKLLSKIQSADHIVFFCPIKFGSLPHKLGHLFNSIGLDVNGNYSSGSRLYEGKSIRFFFILDLPRLFYLIHFGELAPCYRITRAFKKSGLKSLKSTVLGNRLYSDKEYKLRSLKKLRKLGKSLC